MKGKIDIFDIGMLIVIVCLIILKAIIDISLWTNPRFRYDVNGDGQVNVVDMVVIEKYIRRE